MRDALAGVLEGLVAAVSRENGAGDVFISALMLNRWAEEADPFRQDV
jgi:hypothetical protein